MQEKHTIVGVHLTDRIKEAVQLQKILSEYGRQIKTRLGLHEIAGAESEKNGIILLEMVGPEAGIDELTAKIGAIVGVEVKKMVFTHPAP
jgi:hypothetical protein